MKSLLLVILGVLVGAVGTLVLSSGFLTGVGAGAGIVTGLKAGACMTVEAAKERGYITAEQVDEVLNAAVQQIASTNIEGDAALFGGDAECAKILSELRAAAKQ